MDKINNQHLVLELIDQIFVLGGKEGALEYINDMFERNPELRDKRMKTLNYNIDSLNKAIKSGKWNDKWGYLVEAEVIRRFPNFEIETIDFLARARNAIY